MQKCKRLLKASLEGLGVKLINKLRADMLIFEKELGAILQKYKSIAEY